MDEIEMMPVELPHGGRMRWVWKRRCCRMGGRRWCGRRLRRVIRLCGRGFCFRRRWWSGWRRRRRRGVALAGGRRGGSGWGGGCWRRCRSLWCIGRCRWGAGWNFAGRMSDRLGRWRNGGLRRGWRERLVAEGRMTFHVTLE